MKKRTLKVIGVLLALMLLCSACGQSSQPSPGTTTAKSTTENATTQTASTADQQSAKTNATEIIKAESPDKIPQVAKDRKDALIVGITAPEGKFTPIHAGTLYDSYVCDLVFDTLLNNDEQGNPIPWVAEKWEISPDGKTYTFHIKKGIKFTSGDDLTADDVAFTFTAICDPKYDGMRTDAVSKLVGYKEYKEGSAANVSGIKVIDPYTISFTLTEVTAPALMNNFAPYGIMSKKYYGFEKGKADSLKGLLLKPMGSGAYIFKEYKAGQEVDLEANPNYWSGVPKIKNIIMKVTDSKTNIQELSSGGTDLDIIPAKPENITMLKSAGFLNLQLYPENGYGYIGLNEKNDMFKDKKVRQALTYGLDRAGFVQAYYKGYSNVCNVPISTVSWAYTSDVNKYEYNVDKANQLLDEAGWVKKEDGFRYKDGKKFTIHWLTYTGSKYVETLIPILKDNWGKIGVEVVPELIEFSTLCGKVFDKQDYEMYNMSWSLSIDPDPSGIFSKEQTVLGGSNCVNWVNDESETLMKEGLATIDQAKRKEIYQKWGKIANEELPYIYLNSMKEMYAVSSRVKGIELSPFIKWTMQAYKAEIVN